MKEKVLKKGKNVLIKNCKIADGFFTRFMGLMGKKKLPTTEAVTFPKCNSIHTFFMLMPIDVLFVSEEGKVVQILAALKPWKLVFPVKMAKHTVEMQAHQAAELGIVAGDYLTLEGVF